MAESVLIQRLSGPPYDVHTHVVTCPWTRKGLVIDPAGDEDKLLKIIEI